jgi:hypothetical protein
LAEEVEVAENRTPERWVTVEEGEAGESEHAVYPVLDGEGGTKFVRGFPGSEGSEEASYEEWAAQNTVSGELPEDEAVVEGEEV